MRDEPRYLDHFVIVGGRAIFQFTNRYRERLLGGGSSTTTHNGGEDGYSKTRCFHDFRTKDHIEFGHQSIRECSPRELRLASERVVGIYGDKPGSPELHGIVVYF